MYLERRGRICRVAHDNADGAAPVTEPDAVGHETLAIESLIARLDSPHRVPVTQRFRFQPSAKTCSLSPQASRVHGYQRAPIERISCLA